MKNHREILLGLYDYCEGTLPEEERRSIEDHLRECPGCAAELALLKEARGALTRRQEDPASRLPESYWVDFAGRIESALPAGRRQRPDVVPALKGSGLQFRWRPVLAFGTALAACVGAFLLLRGPTTTTVPEPTVPPGMAALPVDSVGLRMERYLKRSRALLVGLQNARNEGETSPVRAVVERRVSRQLAEESRLLKRESLDLRGSHLVNDLEKIFIGLANTQDDQWTPALDIVRSGVEEENLLFKIRMAESSYGHARVIPASYRR